MKIDVYGAQPEWTVGRGYGVGQPPGGVKAQEYRAPDAEPKQGAAPEIDKDVAGVQETPPKGVIRNLLLGHYQGVADVRLRINFFQELNALEQQAGRESLAGFSQELAAMAADAAGVSGFPEATAEQVAAAQAVSDGVEALLEPRDLSRDQAAALLASVDKAFQFLASPPVPAEAAPPAEPQDPVQPAVTPEVQMTGALLEVPLEEPETGPAVAEPDPWQGFQVYLAGEYESRHQPALERMEAALKEVTVLGEPGAPRGNGVAYNKFLAIYNRMRDMNEPTGLVGMAVELDLSV